MKVGDYVRTRTGYIAKYKRIEQYSNINGENEDWFVFDSTIIDGYENIVPVEINKKYFVKSSPNIIDLIEVGDYVNGYIVKDILDNGPNGLVVQTTIDFLYEKDIKSILTKEQFESMEYRIGD